jgi:hypothetical protein
LLPVPRQFIDAEVTKRATSPRTENACYLWIHIHVAMLARLGVGVPRLLGVRGNGSPLLARCVANSGRW